MRLLLSCIKKLFVFPIFISATYSPLAGAEENVLHVYQPTAPDHLDNVAPVLGAHMSRTTYMMQDGLFLKHPHVERVIPGIATGCKSLEKNLDRKIEENTVHYCTLRKDAKWSDGTPISAYDFEFAWKRHVSAKNHSKHKGILRILKNWEQITSGNLDLNELGVMAVEIDGDLKLKIETEEPMPFLEQTLADWGFFPYPAPELFKEDRTQLPYLLDDQPQKVFSGYSLENLEDFLAKAPCSGPYCIQEKGWFIDNDKNQPDIKELVFTKNPHYWNPDYQQADKIVVRYGHRDVEAYSDPSISFGFDLDYAKVAEIKNESLKTVSGAGFFSYLKLSDNIDKEIREAIALLVDRESLLKVTGPIGTSTETISYPDLMEGYNMPTQKVGVTAEEKIEAYNKPIQTIYYLHKNHVFPGDKELGEQLAEQLKPYGINLKIIDKREEPNLDKDAWTIFRGACFGKIRTPYTYLQYFVQGGVIDIGAGEAPLQAFNEGARYGLDSQEHIVNMKKAEILLLNHKTLIPMFQLNGYNFVGESLRSVKVNKDGLYTGLTTWEKPDFFRDNTRWIGVE